MHTSILIKISITLTKSYYSRLTYQTMNFLSCISTLSHILKSKQQSFEKSFNKYYKILASLRLIILKKMLKNSFSAFSNNSLINLIYIIFFFSNLFFIFMTDLTQILESFLKWIWVTSFFAWFVLTLSWTNLNQSHMIIKTNSQYHIMF